MTFVNNENFDKKIVVNTTDNSMEPVEISVDITEGGYHIRFYTIGKFFLRIRYYKTILNTKTKKLTDIQKPFLKQQKVYNRIQNKPDDALDFFDFPLCLYGGMNNNPNKCEYIRELEIVKLVRIKANAL